jgi:hypothetical protein
MVNYITQATKDKILVVIILEKITLEFIQDLVAKKQYPISQLLLIINNYMASALEKSQIIMLERYNIKFILNQSCYGNSFNYNQGIDYAIQFNFEYSFLIDSGNIINKAQLNQILKESKILKNENPEIKIAGFKIITDKNSPFIIANGNGLIINNNIVQKYNKFNEGFIDYFFEVDLIEKLKMDKYYILNIEIDFYMNIKNNKKYNLEIYNKDFKYFSGIWAIKRPFFLLKYFYEFVRVNLRSKFN